MTLNRLSWRAPTGGLVLWAALLVWRSVSGGLHEFLLAETLFLLAPLVLVPLGLPLTFVPDPRGGFSAPSRWVGRLLPLAALGLVPAFALDLPPWARVLLGLPYVLATAGAALHGLLRLGGRGAFLVEEFVIDGALMCLPVGAVWMLTWLADRALLGFQGLWVLLTAIHFHFSGFGCLLLLGALGRLLAASRERAPRAWRLHPVAALGLMGSLPLLAAGIAGFRSIEVLGVGLYVILLPLTAGLLFVGAALTPGRARWLLVLSGVSVLGSSSLAGLWGLFRPSLVALPTMIRFHDTLNALGFVGLGLLGMRWLAPIPREYPVVSVWRWLGSRGRPGR